jgi:DNA-binding LytR/AlgR family response regulator
MNCLIIEDEPLAADVLKDYIAQLPGLKLAGVCENVFTATEKMHAEKIDIIFLDINLPKVNGLNFLKSMTGNYHIILTTAYHQYALDGFNLNVVDYLLKPIEFSRFLQAVNKVYDRIKTVSETTLPDTHERKFYFFNADKKNVKVFADEILYIESLKDYVRIHTTEKKIITKFQIGEMERMMNEKNFIRIHKSYIVNVEKITAFTAIEVEVKGVSLPLGRTYKEVVERRLKK